MSRADNRLYKNIWYSDVKSVSLVLFEQAFQAITIPGRNTIEELSIDAYYMELG